MKKVVRDGMVAVLYSPGYGSGWYTDHKKEILLFHPVLVELVEQGRQDEIDDELISGLLGCPQNQVPYLGGASDLQLKWLPQLNVGRGRPLYP